jgi:hypothetical protein
VDYFADRINPATECEVCKPSETNVAWTPLKDDSFCGETLEQVCCGGECCVAGKCCDDGTCVDCGCTLGDIFFPAGTTNPDNECESCDPSVSETSWTPRFNNTVCGANQDRACCDGSCCSARGCCSPFGDGECSVEYCGFTDPCENLDPCGCTIDGAFYENFEINPANECQRCNVAFSPTSWDSSGVGPCGPNGEQWCCNGICCDLGVCCNLGTITCDPDYCKNCVIDGHVYRNGDRNPSNGCEQCSTTADKSTWSLVKDNFFCTPGGADGRLCCVGTCCAAGEFCNFPSHCEVEP